MPTYENIRNIIITNVEALVGPDFDSVKTSLGEVGASSPYNTIEIALTPDTTKTYMVGSAWAETEDRDNPQAGPDPVTQNHTVIAELIRGVADYLDQEWKPIINASINEQNALTADYNARFSTSFDANLDNVT